MRSVRVHRLALAIGAIVTVATGGVSPSIAASGWSAGSAPLSGFSVISQATSGVREVADVAARHVLPRDHSEDERALAGSRPASLGALPPAPNSLAMGLGALGCLGAVQLTRSMKRVTFGHVPDWYHTHAPAQVGHVRVFAFDAVSVEPVFGFVPPSTSAVERPWLECWALPSPPLIPTHAARGPPAA